MAGVLAALGEDDWSRDTDCAGWTVRDLAGHVAGAMMGAASLRENVRQMRAARAGAKRDHVALVDALTASQIARTRHHDPAGLVALVDRLVEPAARGRSRTPAPLRRVVRFHVEAPGVHERWELGWFVSTILTRDTWLHRIDLARAVGAVPEHDASHDGRIVADIAAEWARRHGRPCSLHLAGAAGGTFVQGQGGPELEADVSSFVRMISGRADPSHELFVTAVPF